MLVKTNELSFKDYYKHLVEDGKSAMKISAVVREAICKKLEITEKTFYNKLNGDSFTQIELEAIDNILVELKPER